MSHESINHDSTAASPQEVGGLSARLVRQQLAEQAVAWLCQPPQFPHWSSTGADETGCRSLDQSIMIGHQRLNPARPILAGEWSELLALQAAHGVEQMLIWQARASRANKARPFGVTPAYYQACATRPQAAPERSHAETSTVLTGRRKRPTGKQRTAAAHDPEREALLREMGVRERRQLEAVSHTLIAAWAEALKHPGLAARFDSPIGFAVQQMRQGCAPPPQAELDRWTERARRRADPYDTWRHLEPAACEQEASAHERRLEARVRAIAPADADAGVLCRLADWIEQGATETEALAHLLLPNSGGAG